ncbi:MAG: hypothetical protein GY854_14090 [Deltaproteobacteria bacterium]|nr:hypothetical protein [Deltaproteobacteria bacterium]
MSIVSIKWRPDAVELRKFGVVVIIGMCLIGLLFQFLLGHSDVAYILYIVGGVLGLPGLTGTVIALPGYWLWMGVAFVMGNIVGRVLLTVIYYTLFTSIGLSRRILGSDKLQLKRVSTQSYWKDIDTEGEDTRYERQF